MSDKGFILDASAILALLNSEPGAQEVQAVVAASAASTVNLTEVVGKLADDGMTDRMIWKALRIGFHTLDFGSEQSRLMPQLRRDTRRHGLSLGDRCCLATALTWQRPAMTADRAWVNVRIPGLQVTVIGGRH